MLQVAPLRRSHDRGRHHLLHDASDYAELGDEQADALGDCVERIEVDYFAHESRRIVTSHADDAIAHARRLNDEGKVYDKAAWETANVVKSVCDAQDTFTTEFPENLTPQSELKATVKRDNEYMGATNIFMREIYQKTVTPQRHPAYYREYRVGEKR